MSVPERIPASEAVGPGSIPGRAADYFVLGVCRIRIRPREGRGPGSIPGEDTAPFVDPSSEQEVSHELPRL